MEHVSPKMLVALKFARESSEQSRKTCFLTPMGFVTGDFPKASENIDDPIGDFIVLENVRIQSLDLTISVDIPSLILFMDQVTCVFMGEPTPSAPL